MRTQKLYANYPWRKFRNSKSPQSNWSDALALSYLQGQWAEQQAADYLTSKGLIVIERNVRKKCGELDLICRQNETWVCVEVKYRSKHDHGHALEMVNPRKINRMIAAFNLYLMDNHLNPAHTDVRIDVVAMNETELTWLRNVTV